MGARGLYISTCASSTLFVTSPVRYPATARGSEDTLRVVNTRTAHPVMLNNAVIAFQEVRFVRNDSTICGMFEELQTTTDNNCIIRINCGVIFFVRNNEIMAAECKTRPVVI